MSRAKPTPTTQYIASPAFDWTFFLLSPSLALGLGIALSGTAFSDDSFLFNGDDFTWAGLLIGTFIHAHLGIVFFRSHGNPKIFGLYPRRFVAAPLLLFIAMLVSPALLVAVAVLTTFWDVYHSALQTFGFARIYDRKAGNDPQAGRRLDWWLNLLLYCGPILAGATMLDHIEDFYEFEDVGTLFFSQIPVFMEAQQPNYAPVLVGLGSIFIGYYVIAQFRLHRRGHRISGIKVFLLASTGFVSIYSWGFNSWGEAFFIMNFFHALQYFGIVWASERQSMSRLFRLENLRGARALTLVAFLGIAFGYGFVAEISDADVTPLWALTLVVSIMHFWYDGFIWSVSRGQV